MTVTDPYPDDRAYVRDELARLDCRLRIEVDRFEGPVDEFGALYVSEAEVRRCLSREPTADGEYRRSEDRERFERHTTDVRERRRRTAEAGDQVRMDELVDRFDLPPLAREVLLVAMAPDVDEKYATVYAYLQDDATRRRPTVGFVLGLLDSRGDRLRDRTLFTAGSPLRDAEVLAVAGDGPLPGREVRVDPHVVEYLLGEDVVDPAVSEHATLTPPTTDLESLNCPPEGRRTLAELAGSQDGRPPPMVAIHGPAGTGKSKRVAALAGERDTELLTLDLDRIGPDRLGGVLDRAGREATLRSAAVHLSGVLDDEERTLLAIDRLDDLPMAVYLTGERAPSNDVRTAPTDHELIPVAVDRADYDARRRYWSAQSDRPSDVDPATIASTFQMSRGAIDEAMEMAAGTARGAGEPLSASHVYAACRDQSSEELTELATRIDPVYDWEDIVLPSTTETRLGEVADRVTNRGTVYSDWGFGAQSSLGNGLVALFSGPSGTGKTMAAEVVANHANVHLYKVDLAAVVSKYVGETESNLGRIFDEAADSDAVLLFDEADALFGQRSEVSDAHDRYANVEVDYLLQRVEEHDGAVLLTTNLESNIDDAFRRRIHLSVEFPTPDREAREAIWRRVFPADAPVEGLDYEQLARIELTGGNIRNAALSAAFYAAADSTPVGMEAVVRAVERECQKTGLPIEPDRFGQYRHLVEST